MSTIFQWSVYSVAFSRPIPCLFLVHGAPALFLSFIILYLEIVHCKWSLFQTPSGSSGKAFVLEHFCLCQAYADCSTLESIALKACSVLVALTLQKPNRTSNGKNHVAHLNCWLSLWKEGNLLALLDESRCIQRHLRFCGAPDKDRACTNF